MVVTVRAVPAWVSGILRQAATENMGPARRLIFADDVAGTRVALVAHDITPGEQIAAWYLGPAGAAPEQIDSSGGDDLDRDALIRIVQSLTSRADAPAE